MGCVLLLSPQERKKEPITVLPASCVHLIFKGVLQSKWPLNHKRDHINLDEILIVLNHFLMSGVMHRLSAS